MVAERGIETSKGFPGQGALFLAGTEGKQTVGRDRRKC